MSALLGVLRALLALILLACAATIVRAEAPLRVAVVNTPVFSGLMDDLVAGYKAQGGGDVTIYGGSDVYEKARAGEADLVISHYGKADVARFVLDGYGLWPKMVFFNQMAIIGPASDPAGIRGLTSAAEAVKKIAASKSPYLVNALPSITYAADVFWLQAGVTEKGDWYLDPGVAKGQALKLAEEKSAYTMWGALPFLRFKEKHASKLELMVTADPLLQRIMTGVVVNPNKVPGANRKAAEKFLDYLLSAKAQARIAAFRAPGLVDQLWWPAGRNNGFHGGDE